jgi:hypothetical protein
MGDFGAHVVVVVVVVVAQGNTGTHEVKRETKIKTAKCITLFYIVKHACATTSISSIGLPTLPFFIFIYLCCIFFNRPVPVGSLASLERLLLPS